MSVSRTRIPEIEGIRGILSLIVLIGHANYFDTGRELVIPWFWGCMEVFFVISGYLITDIALEHGSSSNFRRTFLLRRCLRIWPLYYVVLLACLAETAVAVKVGRMEGFDPWPGLAQCLVFLQNLELANTIAGNPPVHSDQPYAFGHSWSVALEEQFYVLCAIVLPTFAVATGVANRRLVWMICGIVALSVLLRVFGMHWWLLVARFDGFGLGMLLAVLLRAAGVGLAGAGDSSLVNRQTAEKLIVGAFRVGSVAAVAVSVLSYWLPVAELHHEVWGAGPTIQTALAGMALFLYSVFGFGLVGFCVIRTGGSPLSVLRSAWFQLLGKISYSTYLWHIPVLLFSEAVFRKYLGVAAEFSMLASIPVALAVSYVSYTLIEHPFLSMGRKLRYGKWPHQI